MVTMEDKIKAQLGIKYSAAKQLIREAKKNLEITDDGLDREHEILDEATQIFEDDMLPEDQEAMRVTGNVESGFQQRAVAAAQRREAEATRKVVEPSERVSNGQPRSSGETTTVPQVKVAPEGPASDARAQPEEHPPERPVNNEPVDHDDDEEEDEEEEIVEHQVVQGDGGTGGGTTITESVTKHVDADGTVLVTTKTAKRKVTPTQEKTVVCFCTIL